MAAADDLPRGLVLGAGPAYQPSVTFPACPNVSWVLTEIDVDFYAVAAAAAENITCTISVLSNGIALAIVGAIVAYAPNGQSAFDSWSWSGKAAGQPGQNLEVATVFNTGTSTAAAIRANAYPI